MDYTEINRCIRLLHQKPGWFFQAENLAEKFECLDRLQQIGTAGTINSVFPFLESNNTLLQARVAETIIHLFTKLQSLNDYSDALKRLQIGMSDLTLYRTTFDARTYAQLLIIASFNSSGYVREKAISELSRLKYAEGLKFILFRLGDWVPAVRKSATEAVSGFLEDVYLDHFLNQLPTIDWLLKVERADLKEIHHRIIQFIVRRDFSETFISRVNKLDEKQRLHFYKAYLTHIHPTREKLHSITQDRSSLVRAELLKHITTLDLETRKELVSKFIQDKSATVRLNALYACKSFRMDFNDRITLLISDEAVSVRELSRHLLRDEGMDFAQIYRQRIADGILLSGSLMGLSETGNQQDLSIFEQSIHSEKSKVIVASLVAINKFSPETAKQYALDLFIEGGNKVRKKSVEILAKYRDYPTLEKIRDMYANGNPELRKTVVKLFNQIGGWNIIADLLLALKDDNLNIRNLAWQFLDKWNLKATTLFTTPSKTDKDRANQVYDTLDQSNLEMTSSRTKLLNDLKFSLR